MQECSHVLNPMYHVIAPFSSQGGGPLLPSHFPQSHIELALSLQPPLPYKSRLFVNTAQQSKRKLQTAMAEQADLSPLSCTLNRPFSHLWGEPIYAHHAHSTCISHACLRPTLLESKWTTSQERQEQKEGFPRDGPDLSTSTPDGCSCASGL